MPRVVITLYQPPATTRLPWLSPFGAKVETYLRLVDLPYRARGGDPRRNPKGKIPWIDDDGQMVPDSSDIIDHLKRKYGDTLDQGLTAAQQALALVVKRTLEEHLYWAVVYGRWIDPGGWPHTRAFILPLLPRVIGGVLLDRVLRKDVGKALHHHGLGRHGRDDVYRRGIEDIAAVATLLGDNAYMLGDRPTSIDCTVFALTSGVLMHPADNPLKQAMLARANLVAYNERVYQRCFGEHPPGSSKPA